MPIKDQQSDISRAYIIKEAKRLADRDLGAIVIDYAKRDVPYMEKRAYAWQEAEKFPVGTMEDVVLSRVYFNSQMDKIASETAKSIDEKLSAYEALFNIDRDFSTRKLKKTASEETFELLPNYYVAGKEGLIKAGEEFKGNYLNLCVEDRVTFSNNFKKEAELSNVEVPGLVDVYCGDATCDKETLLNNLHFRKLAADRAGIPGLIYDDLATAVEKADFTEADKMEKIALVNTIAEIDGALGLDQPKFDHKIPDAWQCVFNMSKAAEEDSTKDKLESEGGHKETKNMTKSDIVARYGDDALDAIEDNDGEIDYDKLDKIRNLFDREEGTRTFHPEPKKESIKLPRE